MNDNDRVEAVAKALSDSCCMFKNRASDRGMVSPRFEVEWSDMLDESDGFVGPPSDGDVMGRDYYREQARAALAAAGDLDDLDALLDSVHPRATCTVRWVWNGPERVGCIARIGTPISGHVGERVHEATGPTRMAAIRAAVAKAKEVQGGE